MSDSQMRTVLRWVGWLIVVVSGGLIAVSLYGLAVELRPVWLLPIAINVFLAWLGTDFVNDARREEP